MKIRHFILVLFYVCCMSAMAQNIVINEIMTSNEQIIADGDGEYVDWIELYNKSNTSINLKNYHLSDDLNNPQKWSFPSVVIHPNGFLIVFASGKDRRSIFELHTNFKIKSSGEFIILSNNQKVGIDTILPVLLTSDMTYGRLPDGKQTLGFLSAPTPNHSNNKSQIIKPILFSQPSGFYDHSFNLTLSSDDSIYYTLDGSMPSVNSTLYNSPIPISATSPNKISLIQTTAIPYLPDVWPNDEFGFRAPKNSVNKGVILRVRSFKNAVPSSDLYNRTYFTDKMKYSFPVFSLITDSLNLFSYDSGIYVSGIKLQSWNIVLTGNYFQRGEGWERTGNIELFNRAGVQQFSERVGFRISGGMSRANPQKSLRLYFRSKYGSSKIDYPFFPSRNYSEYKRIVLRSSFTYWWGFNTLFQDDLIHRIVSENNVDIDVKMSEPSILFINGEYWGIHNLRERQDKYYLEAIHGVNPDSVDIIAGNMDVYEGSAFGYLNLREFIDSNDLTISPNYEYVKSKMDVNNYMDYFIVEFYFGNRDWPTGNMKLWKSHRPNSKWRWLMYDLDATFSDNKLNPFDSIALSQDKHFVMFTRLLENDEFKASFIDRFKYHLQNTFHPDAVMDIFNQFQSKYEPEVAEHILRWGNPSDYYNWESGCENLKKFIRNRPCQMKQMLIDYFQLNDLNEFDCLYHKTDEFIKVFPNPSTGTITVTTLQGIKSQKLLMVYDVMGKVVYDVRLCCDVNLLDLSFLDSGIYFLKMDRNGVKETQKIIILK